MISDNTIGTQALTSIENKKKYEKSKDFIGWKSPDGKLEVIGIHGKDKRGNTLFKVTCAECSKDPDLFPDGYFVIQKGNLIRGTKPCGCSNKPKWEDWQFLILAHRTAKGHFIVHGFSEEFKNAYAKLNLECLKDGHKWTASINNIINNDAGCPKCGGVYKPTGQESLQKCIEICKEMNYDIIGFVDGYKNAHSRFEYSCKIHGKQNVSYNNFVNMDGLCMGCWKDRQLEILRDNGNGNGYYPERKDEQDFLYVLDFNGKFIKVGRSFDVEHRIKNLRTLSKIRKVYKLRIFTATHQEIYGYEQELHNELRERNFQHYVDWSTECFENDSLYILNKMLDECGLEEVKL